MLFFSSWKITPTFISSFDLFNSYLFFRSRLLLPQEILPWPFDLSSFLIHFYKFFFCLLRIFFIFSNYILHIINIMIICWKSDIPFYYKLPDNKDYFWVLLTYSASSILQNKHWKKKSGWTLCTINFNYTSRVIHFNIMVFWLFGPI